MPSYVTIVELPDFSLREHERVGLIPQTRLGEQRLKLTGAQLNCLRGLYHDVLVELEQRRNIVFLLHHLAKDLARHNDPSVVNRGLYQRPDRAHRVDEVVVSAAVDERARIENEHV